MYKCPGCFYISRFQAGPRSHICGFWYPPVHVTAPSGSWRASPWCQSTEAKPAGVVPGRRPSAEAGRTGHLCGWRLPSSTASDWTAASPQGTECSWPLGRSQRGRVAPPRGRRAGSRKWGLTTRCGLKPRGRTCTSTGGCQLLCRPVPTSWMDTGTHNRWQSGERNKGF